jgi:hypothetical protein
MGTLPLFAGKTLASNSTYTPSSSYLSTALEYLMVVIPEENCKQRKWEVLKSQKIRVLEDEI